LTRHLHLKEYTRFTKMLKIGNFDVKPNILLAPLAGFTDSAYRRIVKEFAAGIVYTEMISSMGIFYHDKKTLELMHFKEEEHPIGAQIFGSDPDKLAYAAAVAEQMGFDIVDINMGCPTPKIVKSGAGAALLKSPDLIAKIIRTVKKSINIPLTIKIRKGFSRYDNVVREIGRIAESEGVNAIAIHGITAEEFFRADAEDWNSIKLLKETVNIPVIGNGGILSEEDVSEMFNKTGVDYVMVGRATLGAPHFIKSSFSFVNKGKKYSLCLKEKLYIIVRHIKYEVQDKGEERGIKEMRKVVSHYIKGMKNAARFREKINSVSSEKEMIRLVEEVFAAQGG
jgi:tRNA-dihydrouridine synthase B